MQVALNEFPWDQTSATLAGLPPIPRTAAPQYISSDGYCILCRESLLLQETMSSQLTSPPWSTDAFCFFEYPSRRDPESPHDQSQTQPQRQECIFRADLETHFWKAKNPRDKDYRPEDGPVLLPYKCQTGCPEQTADLVHSACLQLMKSRLPGIRVSASLLRKAAHFLRPAVDWHRALAVGVDPRPPVFQIPQNLGSTALGSLLSAIRETLPWDVQAMIASHLSNSLFLSLITCVATLESVNWSQLAGRVLPRPRHEDLHPFATLSSVPERISVRVLEILGEFCLQSIEPSTESERSSSDFEIAVADSPVEGIECALGLYGVVALRLLYANGSASAWIGKGRQRWVTRVYGDGLQNLRVVSDGFKIVSMDMGVEAASRDMVQVIWDHRNPPPRSRKSRYTFIESMEEPTSIPSNPRAHFGEFLPLTLDNGENNRLTIYCDLLSTCGIKLNDRPLLGRAPPESEACAVTHYLRPGETVKSMQVVTRGTRPFFFAGPYTLVVTNKRRSLYYAPFAAAFLSLSDPANIIGLAAASTVSGIFFDPATALVDKEPILGLELQPLDQPDGQQQEQHEPYAAYPFLLDAEICPFASNYCGDAYLSRGLLHDARILRAQRSGPRCLGLQITRADGSIDLLGQWNPLLPVSSITTLYDGCRGGRPPFSVTFAYSESVEPEINDSRYYITPACRRYVKDIILDDTRLTDGNFFKWDGDAVEIAWWFTTAYDCVEVWRGRDIEIDANGTNLTPDSTNS